jgi:hypothetical protein
VRALLDDTDDLPWGPREIGTEPKAMTAMTNLAPHDGSNHPESHHRDELRNVGHPLPHSLDPEGVTRRPLIEHNADRPQIMQIAPVVVDERVELYALADDGTIWMSEDTATLHRPGDWYGPLPLLPRYDQLFEWDASPLGQSRTPQPQEGADSHDHR